jgi:streptogramin lyase
VNFHQARLRQRDAGGGGRRGLAIAVFAAVSLLTTGSAGAAVTATEFSQGLMPNSRPLEITPGPDGNVWFTDSDGNAIGRITPEGQITEFSDGMSTWTTTSSPGPNGPFAIVAGPDGNLWFTEPARALIGRITPSGAITEFSQGIGPGSNPMWITTGPDGNIWFTAASTAAGRGRVARITPDGQITGFEATGGPSAGPITAGPDGSLWFTDGLALVGRVTPAGEVTAFLGVLDPFDIAAGPDGNLWFTEHGRGRIARITTDATVTRFRAGISSSPRSIALGPDGNLWFTEPFRDLIGRITPTGEVTEFCHGITPGAMPLELAVGPDGNLWFTEPDVPRIARLSISIPADAPDLTPTSNVFHPRVRLPVFRRPIHVFGRACDDRQIMRVDVSLTRSARTKHGRRCLALSRGGRWLSYPLRGSRCRPRFSLRAPSKTAWRLRLPRVLPKGRYTITSRATDSAGQRETRFSADRGNVRLLRVGL